MEPPFKLKAVGLHRPGCYALFQIDFIQWFFKPPYTVVIYFMEKIEVIRCTFPQISASGCPLMKSSRFTLIFTLILRGLAIFSDQSKYLYLCF